MRELSIPALVEALVFASDQPLSKGRLATIIGDVEPGDVARVIDALNNQYELCRRPFKIVEIAGGYQMMTREEFAGPIAKLFASRRKLRLSQAALETIAIIAYKQPVARMEIENIRGVGVDSVLKNLLDRRLVRIVGRDPGVGRPYLYGTTKEFLSHFGLKKLSDLPDFQEVRKGTAELDIEGGGLVESLDEPEETGESNES